MDTPVKKKIALVTICLNQPYWQYLGDMITSAQKFFLKNHQVDYFTWSDMPEEVNYGATVFATEPAEWPLPTLFRYNLFLQQEDILRDYDYIFYCDADMEFVSRVGDEILGDGLTAAQHPMYAFRKEYVSPHEPNPKSKAYIPRPRFYYAGGFQGGRTEDFIQAMKEMRNMIDDDFMQNYIAMWNDESHWNKYLFDHPPAIVLSPSYVYPDSLNKSYYQKVWGRNFVPKLVTITKKFSLSTEAGGQLATKLATL